MVSKGVDHPGLLLLMYPRPVMVASAVLDFFPIEGARKTFREGQRLYQRFGHGDRIAMTEGYHGHEYSAENQEATLDFLDRFNQMPRRHGLVAPKELPDTDLLCTDSGQVMLDKKDARSLMEVIREYYEERKLPSGRSLAKEYRGGRDNGVSPWSVAEFKGTQPNDHQIFWEARGSNKAGDILVDKYLLHHSKELEIPLLFIHKGSDEKRGVLLWFGENGKAGPSDWQELEKQLQAGYDIVTFDFRGLGETRMPYIADSPDDPSLRKPDFDRAYVNPLSGVLANYVYNSLLTGRPYFLQMIEDAEIASRFVKEKLQRNVTAVTASGDNGSVANAIAEVFPGIRLVPQKNTTILKWADLVEGKRELWPIQLLLPGGAFIQ